MGKVIDLGVTSKEVDEYTEKAEMISNVLCEILQAACMQNNLEPSEAASVLIVAMGRMAGRYSKDLSAQVVFDILFKTEHAMTFFKMGFDAEK